MKKHNLLNNGALMACLITGTFFCNIAQAGEPKEQELPTFPLAEMIVTAEKSIVDETVNVSTINRDDIEIMHIQNVEEALRTVPGIQFLNYGMPGYNLNAVRINGSDQIVVLVDGVRMAEGKYYPFHMLTTENIERIEVLRGVSAVTYGSGAKGGVINIVTRKAQKTGTKVDISTGTFDTKNYTFYHEGAQSHLNYSVHCKKFTQGTTEDADGVKWVGSQDDENAGVKIAYKLSDKAEISTQYNENNNDFDIMDHIYKQDIKGTYHTQETILRYDQKIGGSAKNVMTYRTGRVFHIAKMRNFKEPEEKRRRFWETSYRDRVFIDTLTKKIGDQHTVTMGCEHSTHDYLTDVRRYDADSGQYKSYEMKGTNNAHFLQEEWRFDDHWKFTAGVRHDELSGGFAYMSENTAKSYNLSHAFNDKTNIYVAHNDFFILPTIDQVCNPDGGNDKLLPEKGYNREIGINHIFDKDTTSSLHYFNRKTEQNIGREASSGTYKNGTDEAHGYDFEIEKKFSDQWLAKLGYSYLYYVNTKGTTQFGYLPKNLVTVGIDYKADKWIVGIDGRGFLGRGGNQVKSEGWPSSHYWVFNLGVNYKANKNTKAYLRINNLTNTLYAEHTNVIWADQGALQGGQVGSADWYGMPGRNFLAGVEFSF